MISLGQQRELVPCGVFSSLPSQENSGGFLCVSGMKPRDYMASEARCVLGVMTGPGPLILRLYQLTDEVTRLAVKPGWHLSLQVIRQAYPN